MRVSPIHEIHWEESGNPKGKPAVFVHGGPGGHCDDKHRTFFNPEKYRIVMFDQRGCGKSRPHASLEDNTTWHLVEDMEQLRKHLGIDRWQIFGGSWGSSLALAYAETYPQSVSEMVLRGIFLLRQRDIDWFYQSGADFIFPDAWEPYRDYIPEAERGDFVKAYYKRLTDPDPKVQQEAARIWSVWEAECSKLYPDPKMKASYGEDRFAIAFARIECHYFLNGGFFKPRDQLLREVHRIRHLPAVIVHGRYDIVCPFDQAWALHRAWPEASLVVLPDTGHSAFETGISRALVEATDRFAG